MRRQQTSKDRGSKRRQETNKDMGETGDKHKKRKLCTAAAATNKQTKQQTQIGRHKYIEKETDAICKGDKKETVKKETDTNDEELLQDRHSHTPEQIGLIETNNPK